MFGYWDLIENLGKRKVFPAQYSYLAYLNYAWQYFWSKIKCIVLNSVCLILLLKHAFSFHRMHLQNIDNNMRNFFMLLSLGMKMKAWKRSFERDLSSTQLFFERKLWKTLCFSLFFVFLFFQQSNISIASLLQFLSKLAEGERGTKEKTWKCFIYS